MDHLTGKLIYFAAVPRVLRFGVAHHLRAILPDLVVIVVHFISECLDTRVFLSDGTIVKAEIDLASLGEREAGRVLIFVDIIVPIHIERVDKRMLTWAYLVAVGSIHDNLGDTNLVFLQLSGVSSIIHYVRH